MDGDCSPATSFRPDSVQHPWTDLETLGFALIEDVITPGEALTLADGFHRSIGETSVRQASIYGARNLLAIPVIHALALRLGALVGPETGTDVIPVRGIFFNKTEGANWTVPFHQDLTVPLRERVDMPGWGPWSHKGGRLHAQAPASVLERMFAVRVHLDACTADNGPLRVLPGTHRFGRLTSQRIAELRRHVEERLCIAPLGSILIMRPLLLHASSAARAPAHRRVLHFEFAPRNILPAGLAWDPA